MWYNRDVNTKPSSYTKLERITGLEFGRQLDDIFDRLARQGRALLVVHRGKVFRLMPEETETGNIDHRQDPAFLKQALRASAGAYRGIDLATWQGDIGAERNQQGRS